MSQKIKQLVQKEYGEPSHVLEVEEAILRPEHLKDNDVFCKVAGCPINPSDLATLKGVYGVKQALPVVGGKEGCGLVQAIGSNVTSLNNPGNQPPTAYGLLKEYVTLKEGDTIVQNGANSAVGKYVIQMCKMWESIAMGATEVVTQESASPGLYRGANGSVLLSSLDQNGHFVSYGAMSGQAFEVSPGNLIFKNLTIHGFWLGKWLVDHHEEASEVYGQLVNWIKEGKLHDSPFNQYKIEDFAKAIKASFDLFNEFPALDDPLLLGVGLGCAGGLCYCWSGTAATTTAPMVLEQKWVEQERLGAMCSALQGKPCWCNWEW
uniref:Enoyl-[acyl-carrier-protein] reductase, mitochondrial n=1 Tax=Ditylenchus dipsaci TaxID=166011 RepID=A0A915CUA0_9BILA